MQISIKVENIKCNGCATTIKNAITKMTGIEDVNVDIDNGHVTIEGNDLLDADIIAKKLHSMGYPEPGKGTGLTTATSYVSCMIGKMS